MMPLRQRVDRRHFLALAAMAGAAATLGMTCQPPPPTPAVPTRGRARGNAHLAWAWNFKADGPPNRMASVLAQHNLGLIIKTHNGTKWMNAWDSSTYAIDGPGQVGVLSRYFESYGVPFHTYCVLQGLDPVREAEMCAEVIAAGARSIFIDLEPFSGYWQGTPKDAETFAREFKRRQPGGLLCLTVDPRPWVLSRIPVAELAPYSDSFAPMCYWESFNTSENVRAYESSGHPPGPAGVTPEFVLDVACDLLRGYNLPVRPIGQGASSYEAWIRFVRRAYDAKLGSVSVWRYGVANPDVWTLLRYVSPQPPLVWESTAGLGVGATARVANTGSCLNVRGAPLTQSGATACLSDGTVVTLRDGPVDSGGYRWWLIQAGDARGWAAEGDGQGVPWLLPV